jgi:predicted Zn-dependent protease
MCSSGLRICNRCAATWTRRNGCTAGCSRDPDRAVAAANLGVLEAGHGQLAAALDLWRPAFEKNPHLTALGIDLARGLCDTGNKARRVAERALRHNPDSSATRQLVSELATNGCVKR